MNRLAVYKLIDGERDYQESLPPNQDKEQQANLPMAAWIIFMEKQIQLAKDGVYNLNSVRALAHVRKATALGVACMEHHDTTARLF